MKRFSIAVVTGTRAEFGILRPVLRAISDSKVLQLHLIATGMHLQKQFGGTIKQIREEKFRPIAVPMYQGSEPPADSLARGTKNIATALRKLKPDLVLLLGDRLEMLAAANAALAEQIPIGHLHGGESAPGIWDEQIRHAISKMAQVHFCATPLAKKRIVRMGEDPTQVHSVGAPALDSAIAFVRTARRIIPDLRLVAGTSPLLLLHPSSADDELEYHRTLMLIDLLQKPFYDPPMIHALGPNNDPGHRGILRAYAERSNMVHVEMSLPQDTFWLRMITSGLLIGNSSAGIIEAASFGISAINIGDRQAGRERNENVIDAAWKPQEISRAIKRALEDADFQRRVARRRNLYGDGQATKKILAVLERTARSPLPLGLQKQFHA